MAVPPPRRASSAKDQDAPIQARFLDEIHETLAMSCVERQQTPRVLGISAVDHLADKVSLLPDAEGQLTCASLAGVLGGEARELCPNLTSYDPEGGENILLGTAAGSSHRHDTIPVLLVRCSRAARPVP
jgi:hypothetical protein